MASWGKAKALSPGEAGLKVRRCELGEKDGTDEDRQGTQGRKGQKKEKRRRCKCTGTPTLGMPPVLSGPVAFFIAAV